MAGVTVPFERVDSGLAATAPVQPILVVDDIVKRFETPDGVLTAVDHVSFSVAPGEFVGIIGPSGCGKSTLFNVIGGLLDGYEGTVKVADERVREPVLIHASRDFDHEPREQCLFQRLERFALCYS